MWDIGEIEIDKELSVKNKIQNFAHGIKEENLTHMNEGYIVRVHFGKEDYSTTDAVKTKYYQKKSGARKSIAYPLKGKLICGYCKRNLKVMKLAGEKLFFYCPNEKLSSNVECMTESISNERLERIVLPEKW